ncbi:isoprenoid synthase domain-containing protein [Lactarius pseudohatsudake]|nr:isoprenoid synthase domain-containing protein [Lactarius pseudohatsudake]
MSLTVVYDELSSLSHEDEVQVMTKAVMGILLNPYTPRPEGEWVGVELARQSWELTIKTASHQSLKRLIKTGSACVQAVVQKAATGVTSTSGASKTLALVELDMNLPKEAVHHPVIEEMTILAIDMIVLGNDIASYNVEQARGDDGHNIVTVVMHQHKTDIQGAMNWVDDRHKELEAKFMDLYENKIPKFGEPVDTELARYVDGIGNWVRANDQWSFETERYFGKEAPEVGRTRWVTLLLKEASGIH